MSVGTETGLEKGGEGEDKGLLYLVRKIESVLMKCSTERKRNGNK